MLGSGKTGAVRALVTASSARGRSADLYRRYAAGVYRQALLTRGDPALPEHVVCDVIVNERALARMPERGEDDARYRLTEFVLRRCQQLAAGPAWQARRPGQRPSGGGVTDCIAIYPRDVAALLHVVMRRLASSPAVVAGAGSQVRRPAAGSQ